ncbi:MAG TPA: hypothetical protein VI248_27380 [Kineosporiaceae bacterium]
MQRARRAGGGQVAVPVRDVALAVAGTVLTVGLCSAIEFTSSTRSDGLSWFGANRRTVLPFVVGMAAVAGLQWHAAARLPRTGALRGTRSLLRASAVLLIGILATPYVVGVWVEAVHEVLAGGLFLLQLVFAVRYWAAHRTAVLAALTVVQVVAGMLALAAVLGLQDDLFHAQVAFQLAFGAHLPIAVGLAGSDHERLGVT